MAMGYVMSREVKESIAEYLSANGYRALDCELMDIFAKTLKVLDQYADQFNEIHELHCRIAAIEGATGDDGKALTAAMVDD